MTWRAPKHGLGGRGGRQWMLGETGKERGVAVKITWPSQLGRLAEPLTWPLQGSLLSLRNRTVLPAFQDYGEF